MRGILVFLLLFSNVFAQTLTSAQKKIAKQIYEIAITAPNCKGVTYEHTLIKIAMQESSLGVNLLGDYKKGQDITTASLGIFQFQVQTVRLLQKKYHKLLGWLGKKSDRYIAQTLLRSVDFNVVLAVLNIKRLSESKLTHGSYFRIISQWNGGIHNKLYYKRVQRHIRLVKKLIKEFKE